MTATAATNELSPLVSGEAEPILRRVFASFPSGVVALCALVDGERVGMAASSYTSVSMTPALVSVCIQKTSSTWPRLRQAGVLGISVLGSNQGIACRQLSRKDGDRFAGLPVTTTRQGAVLILSAAAWLECRLYAELDAGDHVIALLEVQRADVLSEAEPLVFHNSQFRTLTAESGS